MNIKDFLLGYEAGAAQGGGGAEGMYLEAYYSSSKPTPNYFSRYAYLGDTLWYFIGTSSAPTRKIYKVEGDTYTLVTTATNTALTGGLATPIEYHGKIHFFSSNAYHDSWDGSTFAKHNNLPFTQYTPYDAVVCYDAILIYNQKTGVVYKWDESSDSWAQIASLGTTYTSYTPVVVDGVYYLRNSDTKAFQIAADGTVTAISIPYYVSSNNVILGDYIYWASGSLYRMKCSDYPAGERELYGQLPSVGNYPWLYERNGALHYVGGQTAYNVELIIRGV